MTMNAVEQTLSQKERELEDYLTRIDDPKLRQLLFDINALRRTKELIGVKSEPAPSAESKIPFTLLPEQNGHSAPAGSMTQGDAAEEILRKAGRPMHLKEIEAEMPRYGVTPKKHFRSILFKDRQGRFKSKGRGYFALNEARSAQQAKKAAPSGNRGSLARTGFSLIGSIRELLPRISGEVSQPVVFEMLKKEYPAMAPQIQKASVATTLRKLADDGLLEVTYKGYGAEPRRYKRK